MSVKGDDMIWMACICIFEVICAEFRALSCARDDYAQRNEREIRTNKDLVHRLGGMLVDVLKPVLNVFERLLVGDVVYQENAHGITVVRGL